MDGEHKRESLREGVVTYPSILVAILFGCLPPEGPNYDPASQPDAEFPGIQVPSSEGWSGSVSLFAAGPEGAWDHLLWGGFAATAVRRNGTFYLYYQGSEAYDHDEETVAHRAIGLATSADGLFFEKHAANPVLTWSPTGGVEEGAASAAAVLGSTGEVILYYGANTDIGMQQVRADVRIAAAGDGSSFRDLGAVVLHHADDNVWGSRDELFPVAALQEAGRWVAYYIPNGSPQTGKLGAAWGKAPDLLSENAPVTADGSLVPVWGPAGLARLSPNRYAVFVSNRPDEHSSSHHIDAYVMDPSFPAVFHGPVETYVFEDMFSGTLVVDEESETWYLFYRDADVLEYRVRTHPMIHQADVPQTPDGQRQDTQAD